MKYIDKLDRVNIIIVESNKNIACINKNWTKECPYMYIILNFIFTKGELIQSFKLSLTPRGF